MQQIYAPIPNTKQFQLNIKHCIIVIIYGIEDVNSKHQILLILLKFASFGQSLASFLYLICTLGLICCIGFIQLSLILSQIGFKMN